MLTFGFCNKGPLDSFFLLLLSTLRFSEQTPLPILLVKNRKIVELDVCVIFFLPQYRSQTTLSLIWKIKTCQFLNGEEELAKILQWCNRWNNVHMLVLRTCEYITLCSKGTLQVRLRSRPLRWGEHSGLSGWAQDSLKYETFSHRQKSREMAG